MRSGTATHGADASTCFRHEAVLYDRDDDLLSVAVPFLEEGLANGDPVLLCLGQDSRMLLHREMPETSHIAFLPDYEQPASTLKNHRKALNRHLAAGAHQLRVIGEIPHPGTGVEWDPWARYEAALNHVFADLPLWELCVYDTRITPDDVLGDVAKTHPRVITGGKHVVSESFEDPETFLSSHEPTYVDPLERLMPPPVILASPSPEAARHTTGVASVGTGLSGHEVEDLVLAVSECVANAILYGEPPVELRIWPGPDRVVVTVSDRGHGPTHPFAGLIPANEPRTEGGLGLWITHQVCAQVTMHRHPWGFTIRLIAGKPEAPTGHITGRQPAS